MRGRSAVLALVAVVALLPGAGPALASCATGVSISPYAFTGTVTDTAHHGYLALVRTEDGRDVRVDGGGPDEEDARDFVVGGRYRFDVRTPRPPFHDSACSATRLLSAPARPAASSEQDELWHRELLGLAAAVLALAGGLLLRRVGRSRRDG